MLIALWGCPTSWTFATTEKLVFGSILRHIIMHPPQNHSCTIHKEGAQEVVVDTSSYDIHRAGHRALLVSFCSWAGDTARWTMMMPNNLISSLFLISRRQDTIRILAGLELLRSLFPTCTTCKNIVYVFHIIICDHSLSKQDRETVLLGPFH